MVKRRSIILCFLFAISLFLTTAFIVDLSDDRVIAEIDLQHWQADYMVKWIFKPESYVVSFGGGIYTKNAYEYNEVLWNNAQDMLVSLITQNDSGKPLSVLDQENWHEMIRNRGVYFRLPFNVSFTELCTLLDIKNVHKISDDIIINGIWIYSDDETGIYLTDTIRGKYYQLLGEISTDNIIKTIEKLENNEIIEYRRVYDLFSLYDILEDNDISEGGLFPVNVYPVHYMYIKPEFNVSVGDQTQFKKYINAAFGKNASFIKKMRDVDESLVYIYGFAHKALRIGSDGSVEYTQQIDKKKKKKDFGLTESLKLSLYTIDRFGGIPDSLYLSSYRKNGDNQTYEGYIFNFLYRVDYLPVMCDDKKGTYGIHIEVENGEITKFIRKIYKIDHSLLPKDWENPMMINDVLDDNNARIQTEYLIDKKKFVEFSKNELWLYILRDIVDVNIGYYCNEENRLLYPVWIIQIGDNRYKFPIYNVDKKLGWED